MTNVIFLLLHTRTHSDLAANLNSDLTDVRIFVSFLSSLRRFEIGLWLDFGLRLRLDLQLRLGLGSTKLRVPDVPMGTAFLNTGNAHIDLLKNIEVIHSYSSDSVQ